MPIVNFAKESSEFVPGIYMAEIVDVKDTKSHAGNEMYVWYCRVDGYFVKYYTLKKYKQRVNDMLLSMGVPNMPENIRECIGKEFRCSAYLKKVGKKWQVVLSPVSVSYTHLTLPTKA